MRPPDPARLSLSPPIPKFGPRGLGGLGGGRGGSWDTPSTTLPTDDEDDDRLRCFLDGQFLPFLNRPPCGGEYYCTMLLLLYNDQRQAGYEMTEDCYYYYAFKEGIFLEVSTKFN